MNEEDIEGLGEKHSTTQQVVRSIYFGLVVHVSHKTLFIDDKQCQETHNDFSFNKEERENILIQKRV